MERYKTVTLSEICDLVAGFAFKSKDFGDYDNKVIKITHITPPSVDMDNLAGVDLSKYNAAKLEKFIARAGDYVLAMTGATIGKIGRIEHGEAYINQRVLLFKPRPIVDKEYLYYVLLQYDFAQYIISHVDSESAQPNISTGTIGKYQIILPTIEVQKKIGAVLRAYDEKREINRKINDNLQQQAFALFENMFKGLFPSDNGRVGDHIVPRRGKSLLSKNAIAGDVPVVAGGLEPSTYHNTANTVPPVITISASGANAGFVNLWSIPVWSSDSTFIDATMTDAMYFWFVLLKKRQQEIYDAQTGSAQPHIYPQHIADLPLGEVAAPKISAYQNMVSPLFATIGSNKEENARLSALRDTLLPRLMSGEIDVSNIDI